MGLLWSHGVAGAIPVVVLLVMAGWCVVQLFRIFRGDGDR